MTWPEPSSTTAGSGTASTTMRHSRSPPAADWPAVPVRGWRPRPRAATAPAQAAAAASPIRAARSDSPPATMKKTRQRQRQATARARRADRRASAGSQLRERRNEPLQTNPAQAIALHCRYPRAGFSSASLARELARRRFRPAKRARNAMPSARLASGRRRSLDPSDARRDASTASSASAAGRACTNRIVGLGRRRAEHAGHDHAAEEEHLDGEARCPGDSRPQTRPGRQEAVVEALVGRQHGRGCRRTPASC